MGKPMPCSVGEVFGTDVGQRGPCPACSFSPANTHADVVISCVQFGRGLYSAGQGLAECTICPVRTAARLGSPVRTPCTLGSSADSVGAAECTACLPGTVSSVGGSTVCERCPRGTYSNITGGKACTALGERKGTIINELGPGFMRANWPGTGISLARLSRGFDASEARPGLTDTKTSGLGTSEIPISGLTKPSVVCKYCCGGPKVQVWGAKCPELIPI